MLLSSLLFLFSIILSSVDGTPTFRSRYGTNSTEPRLIYQFSNGTWVENIAVRSNGHLLVTLVDRPELYEVNPFNSSASLVHNFAQAPATGLLGITELKPDTFALVTGNISATAYEPGSFSIWKVDLNLRAQTRVSEIAPIPEADFLNGLTTLNATVGTVLIADSVKGVIWRLDTHTGDYEIALDDETMKPVDGAFIGINGIRLLGDYLYYDNYSNDTFYRVHIDLSSGKAIGPYELVATEVKGDDFAITKQAIAYLAGNAQNVVTRVYPNGTHEVIAGNLNSTTVAGATSAAFGRTKSDRNTLYVVTSGAQAAPVNGTYTEGGKVVALEVRNP